MKHPPKIRASAELKPGSLGALYDLLEAKLPNHRNWLNRLSVQLLSDSLAVSPQAIYRWFDRERLPVTQARTIMDLSGGDLTLADLEPFLLK